MLSSARPDRRFSVDWSPYLFTPNGPFLGRHWRDVHLLVDVLSTDRHPLKAPSDSDQRVRKT
jgi:hypothetical protein